MIKNHKLVILLCLFVNVAVSQQQQQTSFFMFNSLYNNPAYAGSRNTLSSNIIQKNQWIGFKGAPTSQFLSVHSPLKNRKLGVGFNINNDALGSRKTLSSYLDLSGSIILNKNEDRLSVGISAGFDNYQMNFSDLYAVDLNDKIATQNINFLGFNTGVGVYYYGKKHYVGLSCPSIIEHSYLGTKINNRHTIFIAGYVFKLNSVIDFKPSTLIYYVKGAPVSLNINASFLAYKKIWFGVMYRYNVGPGINTSIVLNDQFTFGYSFDYPLNKLRTNQYGNHEFMLQIDLSKFKNENKIYSPRYF